MMRPGDESGPCPRCDGDRVLIGHGHVVIGAYCSECDLSVVLTGDAMAVHDVDDADFDYYEPRDAHSFGPDPNP